MIRFFTILWVFLSFSIYAQNEIINSPFLVASSGETWIQENYILCFSVGELAIETKTQQNTILTQGFHQEENYQITALNEHLNNYSINIYPNPTSDILNINCSDETYVGIKIKDIKGGIVKSISNTFLNNNYCIDLGNFNSGVYFLEIVFNSNKKQVYKIQKFN